MYRAITYFEDLQDNRHPYNVGDVYPREGLTPTDERINELATNRNIRGIPLIKKEERKPKKK